MIITANRDNYLRVPGIGVHWYNHNDYLVVADDRSMVFAINSVRGTSYLETIILKYAAYLIRQGVN